MRSNYHPKRFSLSFLVLIASLFLPLSAQIVIPANGCHMENFDNPGHGWTFGAISGTHSWSWAAPNKKNIRDDITGGQECIILGANTPTGTYNSNEDSWAMSPVYDLTNATNPYLEFWFHWSNEASTSYDEIWMEYTSNGGSTWQILSPPASTNSCFDQNWYNYPDNWGGADTTACFGGGIGPTNWVLVRKCIASLGNASSIQFRFRLSSGNYCEHYGATVDNFRVCDASLGADYTWICQSSPRTVTFTDLSSPCPDSWVWDFGDGNTSNQQNPTHTYNTGGTYTVTLTATASAAQGCGGPVSDQVTMDIEILDVAVTATNITCFGAANGSATISVTGNNGAPTYNWVPAPGSGQGTDTGTNLGPGSYTVTVSPANPGCPAEATFNISEPASSMNLQIDSVNASCGQCNGSAIVTPSGGNAPYVSIWSTDPPIIGDTATGLCDSTWTVVVSDRLGCTDSVSVVIQGSPAVTAEFSSSPDNTEELILPLSEVMFSNESVNATDYRWNFGDGNDSQLSDPSHLFTEDGEFCVQLIAIGDSACADTAEACYTVVEESLLIPNVFSPNGDQVNDDFFIRGLRQFERVDVEVFDRWGREVFEKQGYENDWNGIDQRNGTKLPAGTYFYIIRFTGTDAQGNEVEDTPGTVTIVR